MQTHPKCADKCKKIMKSCLNQLPKLFLKSKHKYELPSKSSTFPRSLTRRVPSNKNHTLPKCNAFGIKFQTEVLDPNAGITLGVLVQMFALYIVSWKLIVAGCPRVLGISFVMICTSFDPLLMCLHSLGIR